MWFRRSRSNDIKTIIEISPAPEVSTSPQQEAIAEAETDKKAKKIWKFILLSIWVPMMTIFFFLFWIGLKTNLFKMTEEEQGRLLGSYMLLLGFYITVRYIFYQLRESKSLSRYRSTYYWTISEFTSYMGWLFLFAATVVGTCDYLLTQPSIFLYAIELSLFFTALIYALIDFLSASKAYVYI